MPMQPYAEALPAGTPHKEVMRHLSARWKENNPGTSRATGGGGAGSPGGSEASVLGPRNR